MQSKPIRSNYLMKRTTWMWNIPFKMAIHNIHKSSETNVRLFWSNCVEKFYSAVQAKINMKYDICILLLRNSYIIQRIMLIKTNIYKFNYVRYKKLVFNIWIINSMTIFSQCMNVLLLLNYVSISTSRMNHFYFWFVSRQK